MNSDTLRQTKNLRLIRRVWRKRGTGRILMHFRSRTLEVVVREGSLVQTAEFSCLNAGLRHATMTFKSGVVEGRKSNRQSLGRFLMTHARSGYSEKNLVPVGHLVRLRCRHDDLLELQLYEQLRGLPGHLEDPVPIGPVLERGGEEMQSTLHALVVLGLAEILPPDSLKLAYPDIFDDEATAIDEDYTPLLDLLSGQRPTWFAEAHDLLTRERWSELDSLLADVRLRHPDTALLLSMFALARAHDERIPQADRLVVCQAALRQADRLRVGDDDKVERYIARTEAVINGWN